MNNNPPGVGCGLSGVCVGSRDVHTVMPTTADASVFAVRTGYAKPEFWDLFTRAPSALTAMAQSFLPLELAGLRPQNPIGSHPLVGAVGWWGPWRPATVVLASSFPHGETSSMTEPFQMPILLCPTSLSGHTRAASVRRSCMMETSALRPPIIIPVPRYESILYNTCSREA